MSDYLKEPMLKEHGKDFDEIRKRISEALKDYDNFIGVDFVDVRAGGVQISGIHKQIGHYYFVSSTIDYDFENVDEAIDEFVNGWKETDNPKHVNGLLSFLRMGEKYGWD